MTAFRPPQDVNLHEDDRSAILAASIVSLAMAIFAAILRFLAKRVIRASYYWEDWLILMALVCCDAFFFLLPCRF